MPVCTDEVVVGEITYRKKDLWQEVLCGCDDDQVCVCDMECNCDD